MTAPRRLQLRRGNTAATSTYVGAPGELVVNTTTNTLYLHDGSTVGGYIVTANTISLNANITQANLGMRGYVDATIAANIANIAVAATYSNVNVKAYTESMGYQNFGNVNVAAYVTTANSAIIGYIDLANTIQSAQVNAANLAIIAANLGMKGYVDSVASQSIYGNGNVKSYLTAFNGSIIPSANVTYDLGDNTHRWKDLYLSGNTITLGDATISAVDGKLVTTGAAISPPTGAVGFANVQFEETTDFAQIRSYYVDNNFGYTANLNSWTTAPIVWDELRSAKLKENSQIVSGYTPDFSALDTSGGRFANAVATIDATGNIASLTITDGGVGYDSYYPYYATDPTGYVYNSIGRSDEGAPQGQSYRRIGLIPTTASDVGNIRSIASFNRYSGLPTVGSNSYTWTGNTGTTISFTVDWSSNTVTSYTYTPVLPALTSANDWQNWILDYQNTNDYGWWIGSGGSQSLSTSSSSAIYDYLFREALPSSLTYDLSNTTWYPGNLLVNNSATTATLSSQTFFVTFNRTALGYATLENAYGNPVYWLRGLTADSGISTAGDMTVAGDLRVAGDLYVSPTSIYMGNLRISAADGNLTVNTGIKFSDGSVQSSSYSNVQVGIFTNLSNYAYTANVTAANVGIKGYIDLANTIQSAQISAANLGMRGYVDNQITTITGSAPAILDTLGELANALGADANLSVTITSQIANVNANITTANLGMRGYVDSQSFYSNAKVATYLPTYSGNIAANISKAGHTWTFGTDGTTQFPNNTIDAGTNKIDIKSSNFAQLWFSAVDGAWQSSPNSAQEAYVYTDLNGVGIQTIRGADGNGSPTWNRTWSFANDGNLKLPSGGYILNSDDSIYGGGNYSNVDVANYLPTYSGVVTASNVAVAGNVTARYLFGNGSQLTGITAGSSYSNVQVATYLPTYSGVVTASNVAVAGNVTAIRFFGDGGTLSNVTFNVAGNITGTSSNVTLQAGAYTSVFDNQGNVTVPRLFTAGNIQTAGYLLGNGALLTGIVAGSSYSNVQVATYLPTYSGVVTASNVAVAGNVTAQYLFGNGSQLIGIASSYSNVQTAAYLNATGYNLYSNVNVANYLTTATITTTGNVTAGNLITGGALYVANITTTGASGNISGANYITANVILTNGGWGNISQVALITANVVTATSYIKVTPTTVANLISASTVGAGARDFVTDANTTTFGSVVGGSGANSMPVFSNGTSWLIG